VLNCRGRGVLSATGRDQLPEKRGLRQGGEFWKLEKGGSFIFLMNFASFGVTERKCGGESV